MKKLFACFAALVMLLSCTALAEITVESSVLDYSPYLVESANTYYARVKNGYQLFDAQGSAISDVYGSISYSYYGSYYEYYNETETLNHRGLLDANGQKITDPVYGEIEFYGDGWAMGYVLEAVSGDSGDFKDNDNHWYNAVRTDVFFDGRLIGTLGRDEYIPTYSEGAAGNYFYIKQTSELGFYLDKDFNKYVVNGYLYGSSEFTYDYKRKAVIHNPTQQKAFCAGCPLTENDVQCTVWFDDNTDSLLDLQGNVIKSGVMYDHVEQEGDYLLIRHNSLYGVMDLKGNVIVEPKYEDMASYEGLYCNGIQAAVTPEGHLHYLDLQGNVIAKAEYELTYSDYEGFYNNAPLMAVKNMGKIMIISAAAGELPVKYEDFQRMEASQLIMMVKKDGLWGAIDLYGNTVLPFVHRYAPDLSDDSTLALGYTDTRDNVLYRITYSEGDRHWYQVLSSGSNAAPADDGSWTCACGSENTGKFCGECGQKKPEPAAPVDDGSWTCNCGSENTGKFCPECGQKKPEAPVDPQCASCGYKPGDTAPKFCPECGAKF